MSLEAVKSETDFDLSSLREWMKGDEGLILEVLESFEKEIPPILIGLDSIASNDSEQVHFAIHKLRSSLQLVSARQALDQLDTISYETEQGNFSRSIHAKTKGLQKSVIDMVPRMISSTRARVN